MTAEPKIVSRETFKVMGVEVRDVPSALYAVFACPFQAIGLTYGYIWDKWLQSSAYEQALRGLALTTTHRVLPAASRRRRSGSLSS